MPLYIVKSPREPGKTWLLGPYPESKIENIRATAQIHSARSKNTAELVWKCDDRQAVVLYIYDKGVTIFPKGSPGGRDSKRGKELFSCVYSSGGSCTLPANMTGEDAVKGRRRALNPPCPTRPVETDRRVVASQHRKPRQARVQKQLSPSAPSQPILDERPFFSPSDPRTQLPSQEPPKPAEPPKPTKPLIDAHELNRMLPLNLFNRDELTKLASDFHRKRPDLDPIHSVVMAKVELLRRGKKSAKQMMIGIKKSVLPTEPKKRTA